MSKEQISGIAEAIKVAGSQRALADLTGISLSFINKMHVRGWVTPKRCHVIHEKTGVPLERLNPEVFGRVTH